MDGAVAGHKRSRPEAVSKTSSKAVASKPAQKPAAKAAAAAKVAEAAKKAAASSKSGPAAKKSPKASNVSKAAAVADAAASAAAAASDTEVAKAGLAKRPKAPTKPSEILTSALKTYKVRFPPGSYTNTQSTMNSTSWVLPHILPIHPSYVSPHPRFHSYIRSGGRPNLCRWASNGAAWSTRV